LNVPGAYARQHIMMENFLINAKYAEWESMRRICMSYSPKIKSELVRELYLLKHSNERKIPMTKLVNEAVTQYLERNRKYGKQEIDSNRNAAYRSNN